MTSFSDLGIEKVYTFSTRAPAVLGASLQNAKLIAIMAYETAKIFDNIDLRYRSIFPLLPNGTPDSPTTCMYYLFISESGEKVVFADQWIEESTITLVEGINFSVTFSNSSLTEMARIRDVLNAMGYTNFVIAQLS